jgi:hypothetical protein
MKICMEWAFANCFQGKNASMGISSGIKPLPYGHQRDAAVDIDGLAVSYLIGGSSLSLMANLAPGRPLEPTQDRRRTRHRYGRRR